MNILTGLGRAAAVFGALNQLTPILGAVMQQAENLFPQPGSGAQKLQHVLDFMRSVLTIGGTAISDVEAVVPVLTVAINNVVAAAKGQAQIQPPAPPPAP